MRRYLRHCVTLLGVLGLTVGCEAGREAEPAATAQQAAPPGTATPAVQTPAQPRGGAPAGGSSPLLEQMTVISINDQIEESQMQAGAGAIAGGQVAKQKLKAIDAKRAEQMDEVFETFENP